MGKLEKYLNEASKEYNILQKVRQELTNLSRQVVLAKKSKDKLTSKIAAQVEKKIDEIRRFIFLNS